MFKIWISSVLLVSGLQAAVFIDTSIPKETILPVTKGVVTEERVTLLFPSLESLREKVAESWNINPEVVEKILKKLEPIVGKQVYPSEIARLLFEAAFI